MRSLTLCLLCATMFFAGCKSSKEAGSEADGPVLLEFSEGTVTQSEFERVYAKNNGGLEAVQSHTPEQFREYLDLYINFKRKVFEAEAMGLDTTPAFKQEFASYKQQLTQPYLAAKDVEDQLIEEAYDRSGYLVDASHLLLNLSEDAAPADTQRVYEQIMTLRDSVVNHGVSFGELASRHSQDPSAAQNQGRLGYFTVFDMVYPFENGAFTTPVGEVSMPIRSRFGYHLIFVHDKMENQGKKRAAHIIVRVGDRYSAQTDAEAEAKINEIYERLQAGEDFGELAAQFSDDPSSANNGGDLGYNRLLPEMEALRLQLDQGEISKPFTTRFGWHILTVTEVEPRQSLEEARPELKQRISRDTRSQLSRDSLITRIQRNSDYQYREASFDTLLTLLDDRFSRGAWEPDSLSNPVFDQTLFTLANGAVEKTLRDFVTYYRSTRMRRMGMSTEAAARSVFESFKEKELLAYEEAQLPKKNPEYRYLLQEYRDGILLFTLMEQKVWQKAMEDSIGLRNYYESHPDTFYRDQMVRVVEYRASDSTDLEEVRAMLLDGQDRAYIDSVLNQESSLRIRSTTLLYEKGDEQVPDNMFAGPGVLSAILQEGTYWRLLVTEELFPAGVQPLDNVKSQAITSYQDYLEQQWLDELAEKYPVTINEKAFDQLFE